MVAGLVGDSAGRAASRQAHGPAVAAQPRDHRLHRRGDGAARRQAVCAMAREGGDRSRRAADRRTHQLRSDSRPQGCGTLAHGHFFARHAAPHSSCSSSLRLFFFSLRPCLLRTDSGGRNPTPSSIHISAGAVRFEFVIEGVAVQWRRIHHSQSSAQTPLWRR